MAMPSVVQPPDGSHPGKVEKYANDDHHKHCLSRKDNWQRTSSSGVDPHYPKCGFARKNTRKKNEWT